MSLHEMSYAVFHNEKSIKTNTVYSKSDSDRKGGGLCFCNILRERLSDTNDL